VLLEKRAPAIREPVKTKKNAASLNLNYVAACSAFALTLFLFPLSTSLAPLLRTLGVAMALVVSLGRMSKVSCVFSLC